MTWQAIEQAREAVERSCNCDDASECEYTDSVLAALSVVEEALEAAEEYDRWASRMPDAGFTNEDPRWDWWHERPADKLRAALARAREGIT